MIAVWPTSQLLSSNLRCLAPDLRQIHNRRRSPFHVPSGGCSTCSICSPSFIYPAAVHSRETTCRVWPTILLPRALRHSVFCRVLHVTGLHVSVSCLRQNHYFLIDGRCENFPVRISNIVLAAYPYATQNLRTAVFKPKEDNGRSQLDVISLQPTWSSAQAAGSYAALLKTLAVFVDHAAVTSTRLTN